jgi:hypothetical protein
MLTVACGYSSPLMVPLPYSVLKRLIQGFLVFAAVSWVANILLKRF